MSKPDKPKATEAEKLSVKLASQMQHKGAGISSKVSGKARGDARRTNAGLKTSIQGAQMAEAAKRGTMKERARRKSTTAKSSMNKTGSSTFSNYEGGGVKNVQSQIGRGINSTARMTSTASAIDNKESMRDFVESNQRKQALMDAATSAGLAYAYSNDGKKKTKKPKSGSMSVTNPDGSQMSTIVDRDDPLSRPLPPPMFG